jgi:uncharacterized membrane protein YtjA (UPF0391 family)
MAIEGAAEAAVTTPEGVIIAAAPAIAWAWWVIAPWPSAVAGALGFGRAAETAALGSGGSTACNVGVSEIMFVAAAAFGSL